MSEWLVRLRDAWERLSQREQILVGVAGALTLLAGIWFGVVSPLTTFASSASANAGSAEQQLQLVQRLVREHAEVTAQLSTVEQRIRDKGQNSNLLTLLESLARTSGVKVESMEERQAQANDTYAETKVEVELKNVNLAQVVGYLENIERSPQLLSVKSLRVKRRSDKSKLLDVTFSVSSFEPL